jgi:hypothetical protein
MTTTKVGRCHLLTPQYAQHDLDRTNGRDPSRRQGVLQQTVLAEYRSVHRRPPFGRGIVTAIRLLGDIRLAEIGWDNPDLPNRVNVANLSRITEKGIRESP